MNGFDFEVLDKTMEKYCRMIVITSKSILNFAKYALLMKDKKSTKELLETLEECLGLLEEAIRERSLAEIMYLVQPGERTVGVF